MSEQDINENESPKIYRQYDDGYVVRAMTPQDTKIVQKWYTTMGIISTFDLDVTIASFPPGGGFYMGEINGEIVASAIRIPWSENVFYGSMYFVAEGHRGKGYGTRLRDQVAFEYVGKNILCVDAVEGKVAENNQKKYGYVDAGWLTGRYQGPSKDKVDGVAGYTDGKIVAVSEVEFDDLVSYDNKVFISSNMPQRRNFLKKWISVPNGATFVALDTSGHVTGYICRRPCVQEGHNLVGPLYAETPDIAEALLQRVCADVVGTEVTINIWLKNEDAHKMIEKFGFQKVFTVVRQHVNGDAKEYKPTTYALTSIDVCGF